MITFSSSVILIYYIYFILSCHEISLYSVQYIYSVEQGSDLSFISDFRADISSSGKITFSPGYRWISACSVDLKYFPFDTQVE